MKTRDEIADELLSGLDPAIHDETEISDHHQIADMIRAGADWDEIEKMPELENWSETYDWVKNELQ